MSVETHRSEELDRNTVNDCCCPTAIMRSRFGLSVIVVMHSASVIGFLSLLLLKWQVLSQEEVPVVPSIMVETQYLTFEMSQYGVDGGVFSSKYRHSSFSPVELRFECVSFVHRGPNFPNNYPQDTIMFYQFVASVDYRVQIEIDFFQIRGVTPQCTHDYLDVFVNVTDFHLVHNVVNDQLLHRYCGRNKPPLLVSLTNLLSLGFFTEDTQTERGFNGSFRFLSAQPYRNHLQREPCDYLFNSSVAKRGELFSSTYPGTYLPVSPCLSLLIVIRVVYLLIFFSSGNSVIIPSLVCLVNAFTYAFVISCCSRLRTPSTALSI